MADEDQTDIYQVPEPRDDEAPKRRAEKEEPLYQVFSGSRIAVSNKLGAFWKNRLDAALKAYETTFLIWEEVFKYYNFNHMGQIDTPSGVFKRGDSSENLVYSNLNVMLPAVYSKDPDVACSTTDQEDEPLCKALQSLIKTLFKRKDKLGAKSKVKRAAGFGLLTNFGILKLDLTQKDDSREMAIQQMNALTKELEEAKSQEDIEETYGKLEALESTMEVRQPSGPALYNILPHKLIVDPFAEDNDAMDSGWMIEEIMMNTAFLNAKYTQPSKDKEEQGRMLKYKPTHKAVFSEGATQGKREDGLGLVLSAMDTGEDVMSFTSEERRAYLEMAYTKCYLIWDKTTRRVMLFHCDDWKWPIWVWDDPLKLSRFFPYFIVSYGMSTGGSVSVGETAFYLDQQDEVNSINKQVAKIRRSIFNLYFYNSDAVDPQNVAKLEGALKGDFRDTAVVGVRAGERKVTDMVETLLPPSAQFEPFFNKEPILSSINRLSNTSDALRGTQFKTNTNEDAVQTYQEAAKLAVGAKVDTLEDCVSDVAYALAEICLQFYTPEEVQGLIGKKLAEGYRQIPLDEFRSTYSLEIVAGSMEKPNSVYKKKEAVQVAQAVGQFATAAPGSTLMVVLKVLEKAFTEVVILPEDWAAIKAEMQANLTRGQSVPGAGPQAPQGTQGQTQTQGQPQEQGGLEQAALNLPPEEKAKILQMAQQGIPPEQIAQTIQQLVSQHTGATNGQGKPQPARG